MAGHLIVEETLEALRQAYKEMDHAFAGWRGTGSRAGEGGVQSGIFHAMRPLNDARSLLGQLKNDSELSESAITLLCQGIQELIPTYVARAKRRLS